MWNDGYGVLSTRAPSSFSDAVAHAVTRLLAAHDHVNRYR
jgi:hypothetical protein